MSAQPSNPVPLAVRLPNPPPIFRGRAAEVAALSALLKQGPLAVVQGPSGIGKTSLALAVSHALAQRRLAAARYVRLVGEPAGAAALRALAGPLDPEERARLLGDPEALWAVVLDLAEAARAWVVIDEDEAADPEGVVAAAELIGRFARRSRWVVTTRAGRSAALEAVTVALGPLDDSALRALAGDFDPRASRARVEQAVAAAAGSPGWLRLALALPADELRDPAARAGRLWAALIPAQTAAARVFLRAVALVDGVLPAEVAPALGAAAQGRLRAQGLVELRPGGFAMHPAVRELVLSATAGEAAHDGALAAALGAGDDPAGQVAALAIRLAHGEVEAARSLLDRVGAGLRREGWAAAVWRLLRARGEPALATWRMRMAADSGDVEVLRGLALPREAAGDLELRLEWARALHLRGELARALGEAEAAAQSGDPGVARRATRLAVRCLLNLGRMPEALARAQAAPGPLDPEDESMIITCRAALGDPGAEDEARALLARLGPRLDAPVAVRAAVALGMVLYRTGRARETAAVFDRLTAAGVTPLALRAPAMRVIRLGILLALGRLDETAALLESAGPLSHGRSLWGFTLPFTTAALRLARGELAGLGAELLRLVALAGSEQRLELWSFALALAEELHLLRAEPAETVDLLDPRLPPTAAQTLRVRMMVQARRGEAVGPAPPSAHRENQMYDALVAADAALAAGDAVAAAAHATAARVAAEHHGLALGEAQALERIADAAMLAGRWDAAGEVSALLGARAAAMPSARFAGEAAWRAAVMAWPPDLAALERLAAGMESAPTAARRARALLGAEAPLDRVDAGARRGAGAAGVAGGERRGGAVAAGVGRRSAAAAGVAARRARGGLRDAADAVEPARGARRGAGGARQGGARRGGVAGGAISSLAARQPPACHGAAAAQGDRRRGIDPDRDDRGRLSARRSAAGRDGAGGGVDRCSGLAFGFHRVSVKRACGGAFAGLRSLGPRDSTAVLHRTLTMRRSHACVLDPRARRAVLSVSDGLHRRRWQWRRR
ncbi:MAG: hypothetical protein H6703_13590 [Myxococcales bacterium]|nr:hypothetical protein [Myxococcales bacterium]